VNRLVRQDGECFARASGEVRRDRARRDVAKLIEVVRNDLTCGCRTWRATATVTTPLDRIDLK
jgi:hypothetical protein